MKHFVTFGFALVILVGSVLCDAQTSKKTALNSEVSNKVEVYYFHFTRRCSTCHAVEDNAKKALEVLYPDKVKNGDYTFKALNLDDANTKAIAKKLSVGGQTLLVVCANKRIDITDKGFMNAHDLAKMKAEIKKAVDVALKG